jgi:hypothetical protein
MGMELTADAGMHAGPTETAENCRVGQEESLERKCRILGALTAAGIGRRELWLTDEIGQEDIAWIAEVSEMHQMDTVLLPKILPFCTGPEKETLRMRVHSCMIASLIQMRAVAEIAAYFEKNRIRHQLLKGAVLKRFYPAPELRGMSDIDVVVEEAQLAEAAETLEKLGYMKISEEKHHISFRKEPFLLVELHWDLYDHRRDDREYRYFRDRAEKTLWEGSAYSSRFGDEDFYIYMIAHAARHFYETGCGIRHFADIYVYLTEKKADLDGEILRQGLEACGLTTFERKFRELAFAWIGQQPLTDEQLHLFSYMLRCGIYGRGENGIWAMLAAESTGHPDRNMKRRFLFPPYTQMRQKYPWLKKVPFLLPVTWLWRAVSGITDRGALERAKKVSETDREDAKKMIDLYRSMDFPFGKE